MHLNLATSPNAWGVDHLGREGLPAWPDVFDEIREAGYGWVELGPLGYLPVEPGRAASEMRARGLSVAGSFMLEPVHDAGRHDAIIDGARRAADFIADAGGSYLVIVDWGSSKRFATAGRTEDAPRMESAAFGQYLGTYGEIARIAQADYGLTALTHPHAGTWLEFEDEILAMLEQTDLPMCIDTGHFAYAGVDPAAIYDRFADRVPHLNFKDIDGPTREQALADRLGFLDAVDAGIFCPLGEGIVDFGAMRAVLEAHGYDGVATVEQDRDPQRADTSALEDARRSLAFLRSVGLGDGGTN